MISNNILSKEELEALLTQEELEVFKAEQQDLLEHEIMLSPAHLLMALRELEGTVAHLTARVKLLEQELAQKQLEPENLQVVNQVIETALYEIPGSELEATLVPDAAELEEEIRTVDHSEEEQNEEEPYIELQNDTYIEDQIEPRMEEIESSVSSPQEPSLISRSARHRERKPSIFSKLLK